MKCGECLHRDAKMVELIDGKCPVCNADYRRVEKAYRAARGKPSDSPTPAPTDSAESPK